MRIARSSGAFAAVRGREPRQRCASNSGAMPSSRITAGRSPVSNAATTCAHEFAAAQRPGVPEQQDRGVAAFEDLVRPPGDLGAGLGDDGDDVGGEQRGAWGTGAFAGGGVVAADAGHGGPHQLVAGGEG